MNVKMEQRKAALLRIAKKSKEGLGTGKHNRKSVEKVLGKAKKDYNDVRGQVEATEAEIQRLEEQLDALKERMQAARADILKSHDVLQTMDFANATAVRFRKDDNDVAYAIDGKWKHVDRDNNYATTSYSEWKKSNQSEDSGDVNDLDEDDDIEGFELPAEQLA